ncbi:hypothetical protein PA7_20430 [Pseudonocardia asaccharolytica DSM 44247 = NBRC 16224]|uniref:Uncharacterized protein n=1 Tax=Pseudonocardia asaccharolytica DSM 44247 = NBRC 16224 TaxID=1123024 RepID=A0A511D0A4_9PSEU|nr:hypothetical protein PA7_20430 [Pseudonocardia asaccharolytica DSM 44247 = NBRC 16224]
MAPVVGGGVLVYLDEHDAVGAEILLGPIGRDQDVLAAHAMAPCSECELFRVCESPDLHEARGGTITACATQPEPSRASLEGGCVRRENRGPAPAIASDRDRPGTDGEARVAGAHRRDRTACRESEGGRAGCGVKEFDTGSCRRGTDLLRDVGSAA